MKEERGGKRNQGTPLELLITRKAIRNNTRERKGREEGRGGRENGLFVRGGGSGSPDSGAGGRKRGGLGYSQKGTVLREWGKWRKKGGSRWRENRGGQGDS